jgi:hypothetical protein
LLLETFLVYNKGVSDLINSFLAKSEIFSEVPIIPLFKSGTSLVSTNLLNEALPHLVPNCITCPPLGAVYSTK